MENFFENPSYLLLMLGVIPVLVWDIIRRWNSGRTVKVMSLIVRVLVIAAAVTALAQPRLEHEAQVADVIFVVDRSASIPDSLLDQAFLQVEDMRGGLLDFEQAGLVVFDARPKVAVYPGDHWGAGIDALRQAAAGPEPSQDDLTAEGSGQAETDTNDAGSADRSGSPWRLESIEATDVGTALQVALGLIPEAHEGRVVLLTDAHPTQGQIEQAVRIARSRNIPIFTLPIDPGFADPAIAGAELERESVRPGETVRGSATLRGGPESVQGTVHASIGDNVLEVFVGESDTPLAVDQLVEIPAEGTVEVHFEYALDQTYEPGLAFVDVHFQPVEGTVDQQLGNNDLSVPFNIEDPPNVLMVAHDTRDVENLADVLSAEMMTVTVMATPEFEAQYAEAEVAFKDFDLVYLANVPATATEEGEDYLTEAPIEELRRYVSAGGGLIVLGGDRSYELGGYGDTDLATVLPVELLPRDPELEPAVTMMIILDNSGSMGSYAEGGQTKMELANGAAVAAMMLLRDFDSIGVLAVDDRVDWVVPTQRVENREQLERSIRGVPVGGGGIYVYTSLRAAYREMRHVDTPLKHVILFSDAADSEEQVSGVIFGWGPGPNSYDLARSMRSDGITVSVIGIGYEYDTDATFLRNLAEAGGGRSYLTSRAAELQTLFVEETQRVVDAVLVENPFRVRARGEHPAIEGIEFRRSPRLQGYMQLSARQTADVTLTSADGRPIMSTWQYGLGQVAAMAVDAGPRWAQDWLDWDGYTIFWTQMSRWAMRRHEGDDTAVELAFDDGQATMRVARRTAEGLSELEGGVRAELVATDDRGQPVGAPIPLSLEVLEPGYWEADLDTEPGQRYLVRVLDENGEEFAQQSFVAQAMSTEYGHQLANHDLLRTVASRTRGDFDPSADAIDGEATTLTSHEPLTYYFLGLAMLLLPFDAFLRRTARDP